jgi:hypothetical protein
MGELDPRSTKISELGHARLSSLQNELIRVGLGKDLKHEEILAALVLYTPTAQAAWAVREYRWYTGKLLNR